MLAGRNVTGGALAWCHWGMADGTDDDQPDGQIAAATVATIERLGEQPWLIGCGFKKPHDPFIAPKAYFDLYPLESLKLWSDPPDTTPVRAEAVGFGAFGAAFAKFTEQDRRELFRAYCACTTFMDAQLGRVLDVLDRRQLWDKTLVIFASDHGYHTGERQWWNKNTLFERSCRAPLIIAAPGMKGGQTSRSLVEFVDLYPTVADFCGLPMPHDAAGVSLRPVLQDPNSSVKPAALTLVSRGRGPLRPERPHLALASCPLERQPDRTVRSRYRSRGTLRRLRSTPRHGHRIDHRAEIVAGCSGVTSVGIPRSELVKLKDFLTIDRHKRSIP
jgi:iduronate 2-sulfatase